MWACLNWWCSFASIALQFPITHIRVISSWIIKQEYHYIIIPAIYVSIVQKWTRDMHEVVQNMLIILLFLLFLIDCFNIVVISFCLFVLIVLIFRFCAYSIKQFVKVTPVSDEYDICFTFVWCGWAFGIVIW